MYSLVITRTKLNGKRETKEMFNFVTSDEAINKRNELMKCTNVLKITIKSYRFG